MQKIDAPKPIWINRANCYSIVTMHGKMVRIFHIILFSGLSILSACQKPLESKTNYLNDYQLLTENAAIYFDINSFSITIDSKEALEKQVLYLEKYPEVHVIIEGYAEKGEREPMILGYQRAIAIKEILEKKGIDAHRIRAVSLATNSYNAMHARENNINKKVTLTTVDFVENHKN